MTALGDEKRNERREYIRTQRAKGATWAQIARDCGVTATAIKQTLMPTVREMYGDGPFVCDKCGKHFRWKSGISTHNYTRCPGKMKEQQ